ncbi:hypothetical protein CYMTET_28493 [Cymbomonas tetramitiformis]|uniref:Uncharacterized protein n=1 Tax=Cymbomonas tetramitiformis TaxID=36881 RepID=A0AAE0FMP1_9CHLO|nr:hypothetical protein CYMTET_28493 [Cymbomonas tetramitiformis]
MGMESESTVCTTKVVHAVVPTSHSMMSAAAKSASLRSRIAVVAHSSSTDFQTSSPHRKTRVPRVLAILVMCTSFAAGADLRGGGTSLSCHVVSFERAHRQREAHKSIGGTWSSDSRYGWHEPACLVGQKPRSTAGDIAVTEDYW